MLVHVGPMDSETRSASLPVGALIGGGVEQAGIPGERHRDRAAVLEIDNQARVVTAHVGDAFVSGRRQSSHAKPPAASSDFRAPESTHGLGRAG